MKKLLLLLVCAMVLAGCTARTDVMPSVEFDPNNVASDGYDPTIDWNQVAEDSNDFFMDESFFPYLKNMMLSVDEEKKEITLVFAVADDTKPEDAKKYGESCLKDFNEIVAVQNFSLKRGEDEESYGGIFKEFAVSIGVAPDSTKDDESTWFINDHLEAGEYRELELLK